MERIRKIFSLIHSICWLLAFLFVCWVLWSENVPNWFYAAVITISSCAAIFYSHFFLLGRYLNRKSYARYIIGLILLLLIAPFPFLWTEGSDLSTWPHFFDQYFTTLISFVLPCIIFSGLARSIESRFINTFKREALEKQAVQAELSYLKWQINPHFLFNTLNNIHTLAYKQSPHTPDAILRLSFLMRYMLHDANASTVALAAEIEYLQNFISLQQLRYKREEVVHLNVIGNADTCYIAPLLFIHLLENAYKHSPAYLGPGAIRIEIEVGETSLKFSIENPIGNKEEKEFGEVGGIGLANLKKRLQLLYPHEHDFEVNNSGSHFIVVLKLHRIDKDHERKTELLYSRR
ncbi:MAG TPA: histidine kinase [Chitinophagaceae bacterium]|nr:histidine kinase [Chitinophagaceae bacterium]